MMTLQSAYHPVILHKYNYTYIAKKTKTLSQLSLALHQIFLNLLFPKAGTKKLPQPPSPKKEHQATQPLPLLKIPFF
jgi:hypothetical protein